MKARRTYDRTAVVRPTSQVRYDVFTERVANGNRIVRIRYDVGASSLTNVLHFDRKNATRCTKTRHFDIKKSK